MSVRKTLYMLSGTLRGIFFLLVLICILGIIVYIQRLVDDLRRGSRDIVEFYALTVQRIASDTEAPEGLDWFFQNVLQRTNFPLIVTDNKGNPSSWQGINVPENSRNPDSLKIVRNILEKMRRENEPVPITYGSLVVSYLYYGDSVLITRLEYLPYLTICSLGLLMLAALWGFSSIKRSEQRFIWVGMAKETAHQLGTPISSLLGWLEILRSGRKSSERQEKIFQDMESDIKRLEKVAARFSQIGSEAVLQKQDLAPVLADLAAYFRRRLPQSGKEIKLIESFEPVRAIPINRELFEWAIENLIKNSIDAVKGRNGRIEIRLGPLPGSEKICIDIIDNGIGIQAKRRQDVFKAGYSTKKRGWGLGLNFTQRIIEDYHRGRLYIRESHAGKGTTMRIVL